MTIPVNNNDSFAEEKVAKFVLRGVRKMDGNSNGTALASGKIDLAVSVSNSMPHAPHTPHTPRLCAHTNTVMQYKYLFLYMHIHKSGIEAAICSSHTNSFVFY
jgi:hypothetical protein